MSIFQKKTPTTEKNAQLAMLYANNASKDNPYATTEDFRAAKKTLTDGAIIEWDIQKNTNAEITLKGNRTLKIDNLGETSYGTLVIKQDGTGSRTLTLPTGYDNYVGGDGAGVLTLSTAASSIDIASFYFDGTVFYWNLNTDYSKS